MAFQVASVLFLPEEWGKLLLTHRHCQELQGFKKWDGVIEFTQVPTGGLWGRAGEGGYSCPGVSSLKKRKPHRVLASHHSAWSFGSCDEGNKAIQLPFHSVIYYETWGAS